MFEKSNTLCWSCQRAHSLGCDKFKYGETIPGWTATRKDIIAGRGAYPDILVESYEVVKCPQYKYGRVVVTDEDRQSAIQVHREGTLQLSG